LSEVRKREGSALTNPICGEDVEKELRSSAAIGPIVVAGEGNQQRRWGARFSAFALIDLAGRMRLVGLGVGRLWTLYLLMIE
jgi:hypothetical protein